MDFRCILLLKATSALATPLKSLDKPYLRIRVIHHKVDAAPHTQPVIQGPTGISNLDGPTEKFKRDENDPTDSEIQTDLTKYNEARPLSELRASGERARQIMDNEQPEAHEDIRIPDFPHKNGYTLDLDGLASDTGKLTETETESTVMHLYRSSFFATDGTPGNDYEPFAVFNRPGPGEEGVGEERYNNEILDGRYSIKDQNVLITNVWRARDRWAWKEKEVRVSDLLAGVIKKMGETTDDEHLNLKMVTQLKVTSKDSIQAINWAIGQIRKASKDPDNMSDSGSDTSRVSTIDRDGYFIMGVLRDEEESTDIFNTLLGCQNVRWIERMLADHRKAFGEKKITGIGIGKYDTRIKRKTVEDGIES